LKQDAAKLAVPQAKAITSPIEVQTADRGLKPAQKARSSESGRADYLFGPIRQPLTSAQDDNTTVLQNG
jgi:hypothetical protein